VQHRVYELISRRVREEFLVDARRIANHDEAYVAHVKTRDALDIGGLNGAHFSIKSSEVRQPPPINS
jgi:hypothetical protein